MADDLREQYWRRRAAKLARGVNFAWWWDRFVWIGVPLAVVAACAVLILRASGQFGNLGAPVIGGVAGGLVLAAAVAAWIWARGRFVDADAALVRLEKRGGMRNALSAAAAGVLPWPDPESRATGGYKVRHLTALGPFALALVCLLAAIAVPISVREAAAKSDPDAEPMAWAEMEAWAELLEEEEVITEESADSIREDVDGLREKPEEDRFSHSSLEASDAMRTQLERQIRELGKQLASAERVLGELKVASDEEAREKLSEEFQKAMEAMGASPLKLDANLAKQLAGIDPSQLKMIDPAQMKELRERLRNAAGA